MTTSESSSSKVPYDLRPRKQVERRMMAHVFQLLAEAGFPISTYRYAGFGAFFFVDFILFRQLLGITDMVSIEHDVDNQKRVLFNRPFKDIDIRFQPSSEYISSMNRDRSHILWLDYDGPIAQESLADLEIAASILSSGSILIATLDVDFDKANDIRIRDSAPSNRAQAWLQRFQEECGVFLDPTWNVSNFCSSEMPNTKLQSLVN
jgi:Putative O-methyltransferase